VVTVVHNFSRSRMLANGYIPQGDPIGRGSYGRVCRCASPNGKIVAVKQIRMNAVRWQEVEILRNIQHTNIVPYFDSFAYGDHVYIVQALADGNLDALISNQKSRRKPMSDVLMHGLMHQMCKGVAFLHDQGYMHRDLKPLNVLISGTDLWIADFGLATEIDDSHNVRGPYDIVTMWYRAPEITVAESHEDKHVHYDERIDVWSLGCIYADLLFTGDPHHRSLYDGFTVAQMRLKFAIKDIAFGGPPLARMLEQDYKRRAFASEVLEEFFA
jgi:negative regulator of PHO system